MLLFAILVFRAFYACLHIYLLLTLYQYSLASSKVSESTETLQETFKRKYKGHS